MSTSIGTDRANVPDCLVSLAIDATITKTYQRINQKGYGTWKSSHEIYGIIAEEVMELLQAIHDNKPLEEVQKELIDIAVACLFGHACIENRTVDW